MADLTKTLLTGSQGQEILTEALKAVNTKADAKHTHKSDDIESLAASKITGVLSLDNIPHGALERLVVVADDEALLALTTENVQAGDTVKVEATSVMYFVVDEAKLGTKDAFSEYTAGTATSVDWTGVTNKPETFTPSEHNHNDAYYTKEEIDTTLGAYAKTSDVPTKVGDLENDANYITLTDIPTVSDDDMATLIAEAKAAAANTSEEG